MPRRPGNDGRGNRHPSPNRQHLPRRIPNIEHPTPNIECRSSEPPNPKPRTLNPDPLRSVSEGGSALRSALCRSDLRPLTSDFRPLTSDSCPLLSAPGSSLYALRSYPVIQVRPKSSAKDEPCERDPCEVRMDMAATERGPPSLFHRNAGGRSWRAPLRRRRAGDTRCIVRS